MNSKCGTHAESYMQLIILYTSKTLLTK